MRQTQNTQKNSNKKSVFVIALLLLLVAVIGFGGYTMSKYISSKSDNGTASVAKWGFTVDAKATNIFGTEYKYDTAANTSISNSTTGTVITVKAAEGNTSNLVAPGTTGSMTFSIAGTAEVRSKIEVSLSGNDVVLKYRTSANEETPLEYAPIKWTLKKKGETNALVNNGSFKDLQDGLVGLNATVEANANYTNAGEYTIEWAWAFDGTASNANADKLDTLLGMVATKAGATHDALTNEGFTEVVADTKTAISFNLSVSVTQLQQ